MKKKIISVYVYEKWEMRNVNEKWEMRVNVNE